MSRRSPVLVSAPATEPVTLSALKAWVKQDTTDDDTLLTSLIVTARRACEEYTKRSFITQTWKLVLDGFGDGGACDAPEGFSIGPTPPRSWQPEIQLARLPVQSITSIKSTNTANGQSTVASSSYTLDAAGGRVLLNDGSSWPTDLREDASVEILTVNGYGDNGGNVPDPIKQAIIQYAGSMYTSRQCGTMPDGCKELLAPYCAAEAFVPW